LVDYHIHTIFSCDSLLEPEMVCNRAVELGFDEIAFTEHLDFDPQDEGYGHYDYESITEKIVELTDLFQGRLIIKKGVEVTYQREREDKIRGFLNDKDYDFVIGSIHLIGDVDVSQDEGTKEFFRSMDRREAYLSYFKVTKNLVNSSIFDCIGHFEMIRRYALKYTEDYSYDEFGEQVDEILESIVRQGATLEVNTSGIRHEPGETYPRMEIVKRFLNLGGKYLTIGSDAHLPEHIGYKIPETMELLESMGVNGLTRFNKRVKIIE